MHFGLGPSRSIYSHNSTLITPDSHISSTPPTHFGTFHLIVLTALTQLTHFRLAPGSYVPNFLASPTHPRFSSLVTYFFLKPTLPLPITCPFALNCRAFVFARAHCSRFTPPVHQGTYGIKRHVASFFFVPHIFYTRPPTRTPGLDSLKDCQNCSDRKTPVLVSCL